MNKAGAEQASNQDPSGPSSAWSQGQAMDLLQQHTESFASAMIQGLEDFFGIEAQQKGDYSTQKGYLSFGDVHVSVPFSGVVNGEYVINLDEGVAAQLMDQELDPEASEEEREELREELGAAMCELLNTAVGTVICELSQRFPHLSFASPRISYGQRVYPLLRFGLVDLKTDCGELRCHFYVDHMELDLATSYIRVKEEAAKARAALQAHMELVDRILTAIQTAVFWVKPDGTLFRRHSKACPEILGVDFSSLKGPSLSELVTSHTADPRLGAEVQSWVEQAFQSTDPDGWEEQTMEHCPLQSSTSQDGTPLEWRWLAVRGLGSSEVSALLVAVDRQGQGRLEQGAGFRLDIIEQLARSEWSMMDAGSWPTSGLMLLR